MASPSSRRPPRVCFGAVAKPAGPRLGCARSGREPGRWARPSLSSGPQGVNKSARGALCGPNPGALGAHPAAGPLWQSIFAQSTAGRTKRHNGALGAGDVRGVHIKEGQRMGLWGPRREGEGPPSPTHPAPFSALIAGSEPRSQAEVSLGFCWACHWVPLSSAGSMLDSIWPAGPREREEGPAQNPNCVRLSNPLLLSVKGRRIKNSCYIYWGGGWRRGKSHPCL